MLKQTFIEFGLESTYNIFRHEALQELAEDNEDLKEMMCFVGLESPRADRILNSYNFSSYLKRHENIIDDIIRRKLKEWIGCES